MKRISVFGLGYVGAVSGACLAELGHTVVGVDVDTFKVDTVNRGESPIVEELVAELTRDMVAAGKFSGTTNVEQAVLDTEISLICVGTPSTDAGGLDTRYVQRVAEQIGEAIAKKSTYHLVVVRSTVLPGTVHNVVLPALIKGSGKDPGEAYGVCFHPEFLREGTSVKDFRDPPKIVIGSDDTRSADTLAEIYTGFEAPLFKTSVRAAEMVKYTDNCFHALKVVFGNEIGTVCKNLDIDSHEVMRIFCKDTKLNISPSYLMPGFAYGGSCLPKDLRALNHLARMRHVDLPVLSNVHRSNEQHIMRTLDLVTSLANRNVGMLGLSFKRGTDDLRESPLVELAERLLGKGCRLRIFDENVSLSRLRGGNKAYIEQKLPHISELLMESIDDVVSPSGIIIVGTSNPQFAEVLQSRGQSKVVVDLVRLFKTDVPSFAGYHGVCW